MSSAKGRDEDKTGAEEQGALFGITTPVDDKVGHRQRLRDRFRTGGANAVPDYELLEMILFRVFPRGDTKPIAKKTHRQIRILCRSRVGGTRTLKRNRRHRRPRR